MEPFVKKTQEKRPVSFNEKELIMGLKEKNPESLKYLIDNFSSPLYGFIKRIVQHDWMAEEVLQASFLNIWRTISFYIRRNNKLFIWMSNIARNTALEYLRLVSGEKERVNRSGPIENAVSISFPHKRDIINLHEYIHMILPHYRVVLELSFIRGYSHVEISQLLQIPEDLVRTRINNAFRELKMVAG